MKLGVKIQLLTFSSEVLMFIFLALGLSLFFCGVWILFDRGNLLATLPSDELRTVGAGLLMIGAVVAVVSVVGCLAAVKENRFLLLTYLGFLIVLLLGQLYISLLLLINKHKIHQRVDDTLYQMILTYNGSSDSQNTLIDNIQYHEECCGLNNTSDWLKNSHIQSLNRTDVLPCSCFNSSRPNSTWCSTEPSLLFNVSCKNGVSDWLHENILIIAGMDFGLMFVQGVLLVLMGHLYHAIGRKAALKRIPLADANHAPEDDLDYGQQNYSYIDPDP